MASLWVTLIWKMLVLYNTIIVYNSDSVHFATSIEPNSLLVAPDHNHKQSKNGALPPISQLSGYGLYFGATSPLVYTDLPAVLIHTASPPAMHIVLLELQMVEARIVFQTSDVYSRVCALLQSGSPSQSGMSLADVDRLVGGLV